MMRGEPNNDDGTNGTGKCEQEDRALTAVANVLYSEMQYPSSSFLFGLESQDICLGPSVATLVLVDPHGHAVAGSHRW